jgi:hypothetical protein
MIRTGIARVGALTAQYIPASWQGRLGEWVCSRRPAGPAESLVREELMWADSASGESLETASLEKALAMARYAGAHVPYYRSLFARKGIRPEEIRTLEQFREIPLLQRSDVMGNPGAFISEDPAIGSPLPMTTGGSTGIPLRFSVERGENPWVPSGRPDRSTPRRGASGRKDVVLQSRGQQPVALGVSPYG